MKIMSIQQYRMIRHGIPYIYELKRRKKALLYFGADHSNDPKHPQFKMFKSKFLKFKPEIALIEGGVKQTQPSEKEATKHGEGSFVGYLAQKSGIPVISCEPLVKYQLKILLKKFPKDVIFAQYILRDIPWYVGRGKEKGYFERLINWFKKESYWKNFDYSMKNLKRINKKTFGKELDLNAAEFYKLATSPVRNISILNDVARELTKTRDKYIVSLIKKKFSDYNRILVIMGCSHAVMQEPALRELFRRGLF